MLLIQSIMSRETLYFQGSGSNRDSLRDIDGFLLTLVKLRHNPGFKQLGHQFGVADTTASRNFQKWIHCLYCFFRDTELSYWQTKAEVQATMPKAFRDHPDFCRVRVRMSRFYLNIHII